MSNSSDLENQWRSWTPRGPSPKLKSKLFPANVRAEADASSVSFGGNWRWLAPALGCFLLALVVFNPREGRIADWSAGETNALLGTVLSNRPSAAYLASDSHSRLNGLGRNLVEWTTGQRAAGNDHFLPTTQTNSLLR